MFQIQDTNKFIFLFRFVQITEESYQNTIYVSRTSFNFKIERKFIRFVIRQDTKICGRDRFEIGLYLLNNCDNIQTK